ncbi:curlin subunit CsgB [Vibrio makurazakiensis]|uniref:curlin subunit CsgB n=1 Tax=Vibrio makurazakiensis TaxID=2910250 RepID=UPI003D0DF2B9
MTQSKFVLGIIALNFTMCGFVYSSSGEVGSEYIDGHSIAGFGQSMSDISAFNELENRDEAGVNNYSEVVISSSYNSSISIIQLSNGGASNRAKVLQHQSSNSEANILQYGSGHVAYVSQTGDGNSVDIGQVGYGHTSWVEQNGNNNTAVIGQGDLFLNDPSEISLNQSGNNNSAYLYDKGGSSYGITQDGNDSVMIVGAKNMGVYITQH